jgi:Replication protein
MTPQKALNLPLENEEIWAEQIWRKTLGLVDVRVSDALAKCGKDEWYRTCRECRDCKTFFYRCSLKFCPRCNWRIARARAEIVKYWALLVKQPKHVVLTSRNAALISRETLRKTMKAFGKLRRQKEWKQVTGGCVSMEVTNESRGWHVHLHVLCDVRWLDNGVLSRAWGALVGQDFAIVKVQDCRERHYLNEVTKYVVKASQMAAWPAEEIAAFIGAVRGVKFFAPFGNLYKMQRQIKAELDALKPDAKPCDCGACDFIFEDEKSGAEHEIRKRERRR